LDLASELKSKPLRDLTPNEEVDLENFLMEEALYGGIIKDGINGTGEENDVGKRDEVDEDFEEKEDDF
jgi:hypothetical protein